MTELFHPALDTTIRCTERAAPILMRSGWQRVDESPTPVDETPAPGEPETPDPEEES